MVPISAKAAAERRSRIRLSCSLVLRKSRLGRSATNSTERTGVIYAPLRKSALIGVGHMDTPTKRQPNLCRSEVNYRRWPRGNPRCPAFRRSAPIVRFIALATFFTGDLLRECSFNSRMSCFVQGRALVRPSRFIAIYNSCVKPISVKQIRHKL